MQEIITNAATGEVTIRELTPDEIAAMTPDSAVVLAQWRTTAECSRMQGILALGEVRWGIIMQYHATATWAEKIIIANAPEWRRNSKNIAFFWRVLNLSNTEMDDLFQAATQIEA